jgi:D-alanine-D-alanine ligase
MVFALFCLHLCLNIKPYIMQKHNIAVVMGGYSDEYKVSLKSGQLIFDELNRDLYHVYKIHILKDAWYLFTDDEQKLPINRADFSVNLPSGDVLKFDVCFNTIHGTPGENGLMQAYWDVVGQKYTGCDFYQSALTFNKKDTLAVLAKYGIPSAKSVYLRQNESINQEAIIETVGLPCFVKPNQSGSSLGISKVKQADEMPAALAKAFAEDHEILIESFLDGTEVSVGVVDYLGKVQVIGITEIISETEFFDYEAKYEGKSQEITPARLDDETRIKVENIAQKAYIALGMKGFSRSEFILVAGEPFFLEMNTNPGFSPASILPQQARAAGISIQDLCGQEVEKALGNITTH